ncbi:hypothetical protein F5144DRAFT_311322 [Chaetomium tenue]|uniref:Uncharacterized protein n=1 Tax=Chaetomium tenue TaxID=1854479 RepID=A0ACB7P442_9PEZI|nr:hypothetical protein F5144DRAFT_311322 [Chaetomium globosum]
MYSLAIKPPPSKLLRRVTAGRGLNSIRKRVPLPHPWRREGEERGDHLISALPIPATTTTTTCRCVTYHISHLRFTSQMPDHTYVRVCTPLFRALSVCTMDSIPASHPHTTYHIPHPPMQCSITQHSTAHLSLASQLRCWHALRQAHRIQIRDGDSLLSRDSRPAPPRPFLDPEFPLADHGECRPTSFCETRIIAVVPQLAGPGSHYQFSHGR